MSKTEAVIYHNPRCSTSRNTLARLREHGVEPTIIEYLKTPLSRDALKKLVARMGVPVRDVIRTKEPVLQELGLEAESATDAQLLDAMAANPILMNRPIVVTSKGARLCRPIEVVDELL